MKVTFTKLAETQRVLTTLGVTCFNTAVFWQQIALLFSNRAPE